MGNFVGPAKVGQVNLLGKSHGEDGSLSRGARAEDTRPVIWTLRRRVAAFTAADMQPALPSLAGGFDMDIFLAQVHYMLPSGEQEPRLTNERQENDVERKL